MEGAVALAERAARVRQAAASGARLRIRGGGTKTLLSGQGEGDELDLAGYEGIVAYEPSELFVTVRAGTPLAQLESALAERGQFLPFEPPRLGGAGGTVGGMVASGLAGPGRGASGSVRDFLLGAVVLDGRGELLRFGGEVMKNVAGYDVARVFAGSWGALGLVCEVSLKVLPMPPGSLTLRFEMAQEEAIARVNAWSATPLPIQASAWWQGTLAVRLRGARAAVASAATRLGGEAIPEEPAVAFWRGLRDQTDDFFVEAERAAQAGRALWRLSLPSTSPAIAHGEDTLLEWGGAQRWIVAEADDESLAAKAALAGGSAQRVRGGPPGLGLHSPMAPSAGLVAIMKRLKSAFDPQGVFVPGAPTRWCEAR